MNADLNDVFHIWFAIPRLATIPDSKDDQSSSSLCSSHDPIHVHMKPRKFPEKDTDKANLADVVIHTQVITMS